MRTTGDGRGDGPCGGRSPDTAPNTDTTRTFARGTKAPGSAAAGTEPRYGEATQRFVRAPADPVDGDRTRVFSRTSYDIDEAGPVVEELPPEPTRTFSRPEPAPRERRRRRIRPGRIIALVLLIAIAIPPGTWGWVWWTARQDGRPPSDAIIVLGASQYNGTPSPIFEARLRHAAELYSDGVAPTVVTVGGNQPGDNFTEGVAGRDWLVDEGVPAESIVAIGEGSDTLQSIEAISGVFQENGWSTAVIVTDPWHSLRSRIMADDFGIDAATSPSRSGPAVIEREIQLRYITRETASLWYYWIFGDSSDIEVDAAG
ncbi:MAG: YdcF family protein [Nocardiopsaceae bacterium]|nr:YdcF family protein [Nocardiopsaceae bacterium]